MEKFELVPRCPQMDNKQHLRISCTPLHIVSPPTGFVRGSLNTSQKQPPLQGLLACFSFVWPWHPIFRTPTALPGNPFIEKRRKTIRCVPGTHWTSTVDDSCPPPFCCPPNKLRSQALNPLLSRLSLETLGSTGGFAG